MYKCIPQIDQQLCILIWVCSFVKWLNSGKQERHLKLMEQVGALPKVRCFPELLHKPPRGGVDLANTGALMTLIGDVTVRFVDQSFQKRDRGQYRSYGERPVFDIYWPHALKLCLELTASLRGIT